MEPGWLEPDPSALPSGLLAGTHDDLFGITTLLLLPLLLGPVVAVAPLGACAGLAALLVALALSLSLAGFASHNLLLSLICLRCGVRLLCCWNQRAVLLAVTTLLTQLTAGLLTAALLCHTDFSFLHRGLLRTVTWPALLLVRL